MRSSLLPRRAVSCNSLKPACGATALTEMATILSATEAFRAVTFDNNARAGSSGVFATQGHGSAAIATLGAMTKRARTMGAALRVIELSMAFAGSRNEYVNQITAVWAAWLPYRFVFLRVPPKASARV